MGEGPKNLDFKTESSLGGWGMHSPLRSKHMGPKLCFSFTIPSEDKDLVGKVSRVPQWTWSTLHLLVFLQGLSKSGAMERRLLRLSHLILTANKQTRPVLRCLLDFWKLKFRDVRWQLSSGMKIQFQIVWWQHWFCPLIHSSVFHVLFCKQKSVRC